MPKLMNVCAAGCCLLWLVAQVVGCGSSTPKASDEAQSESPAAGSQAAGNQAAGNQAAGNSSSPGRQVDNRTSPVDRPIDFEQETGQLVRLIGELVAIHQRSANYGNVQSLSKDSDLKIREVETVAYRLQGAAPPDEQLARRLESGVVVALDEATKKCTAAELRSRRTSQVNSLSPGNLVIAANLARNARKRMLASISPSEPPSAVATKPPPSDLDETLGGDAGFAPTTQDEAPQDEPLTPEELAAGALFAAKPADAAAGNNRLWRTMVDPAVGESVLAADATFAITIPGLTSSGPTADMNEALKMQARDVQAQQAGVLYPLVPGPIVRIGSNTTLNHVSEVWNYVTNKKLGAIRKIALGDCNVFAISSDGAYFAAQPFQESLLGIWDVKAGKALGAIKIEDWSGLEFVAFGVQNRLVIFDDERLKIYTMPDGKQAFTSEPLGAFSIFEHAAITPGGKYVLLIQKKSRDRSIAFFNVLTGECDARLPIDDLTRCDGLVVSPKGDRLFMLASRIDLQVQTYDLHRGRLESDVKIKLAFGQGGEISTGLAFYHGPDIAVFPDSRRLLLGGYHIVDATTGDLLQTLPVRVGYWVGIVGDSRLGVVSRNKIVPWKPPGQ